MRFRPGHGQIKAYARRRNSRQLVDVALGCLCNGFLSPSRCGDSPLVRGGQEVGPRWQKPGGRWFCVQEGPSTTDLSPPCSLGREWGGPQPSPHNAPTGVYRGRVCDSDQGRPQPTDSESLPVRLPPGRPAGRQAGGPVAPVPPPYARNFPQAIQEGGPVTPVSQRLGAFLPAGEKASSHACYMIFMPLSARANTGMMSIGQGA